MSKYQRWKQKWEDVGEITKIRAHGPLVAEMVEFVRHWSVEPNCDTRFLAKKPSIDQARRSHWWSGVK